MTQPNHILAISTSTGIAKVAIVQFEAESFLVRHTFSIEDYKAQSAELLPRLQQALHELALQPQQIAAIGVDIGPGGFTSLRTACGIAQGLCVAWGLPAVPVSSFESMVAEHGIHTGLFPSQPVTCIMDARLQELYCAQLQLDENLTQHTIAPYLLPVDQLQHQPLNSLWLGDAAALALAQQHGVPHGVQSNAGAVGVAWVAWREVQAGRAGTALDCQPMYVRNKVADTTSERLARKHGAA
jgi:tRNA threonylcarbamoyladenosine biosynthesis protein TsaB